MATQVFNGEQFEAAVLEAAITRGLRYQQTARGEKLRQVGYDNKAGALFQHLSSQAIWMVDNLLKLEKEDIYAIKAVTQSAGAKGDPRDLVLMKKRKQRSDLEIGLSCKKDSNEIKSLRLGPGNISFLWFRHDDHERHKYPTTDKFRQVMMDVHHELTHLAQFYPKFRDIPSEQVESTIFGPTINAFCELIEDNMALYGNRFCQDLFRNVFGTKDYYLLKAGKRASLEGYNLDGTLACQKVTLPAKALYLALVDKNKSGFERYTRLFFGGGWTVSYRLKNGDSSISKNALKFTIELVGKPSTLFRTELI